MTSCLLKLIKNAAFRYVLFEGSLVGLYHNGGPLPWDDDVDVLMTEADTLKLIELVANQKVTNTFRMIKTSKISGHISKMWNCTCISAWR